MPLLLRVPARAHGLFASSLIRLQDPFLIQIYNISPIYLFSVISSCLLICPSLPQKRKSSGDIGAVGCILAVSPSLCLETNDLGRGCLSGGLWLWDEPSLHSTLLSNTRTLPKFRHVRNVTCSFICKVKKNQSLIFGTHFIPLESHLDPGRQASLSACLKEFFRSRNHFPLDHHLIFQPIRHDLSRWTIHHPSKWPFC